MIQMKFTDLNVSHVNKEWAIFFWFSFSITALGQIRRVVVFFLFPVLYSYKFQSNVAFWGH